MAKLCILGAGSWGTGLAIALASRFDVVSLWTHNTARAASLALLRENTIYLPGFPFPFNIQVEDHLKSALAGSQFALLVVPAQALRETLRGAAQYLPPSCPLISAAKGIEEGSLCRMTEIVHQETPGRSIGVAALSGPTFARGIAAGEPSAIVIASEHPALAASIQHAFATPSLRLYASSDVIGVELGAALKNIIAIGAGLCSGLGLGSNSAAALVTRGLAEISRLAVAAGGSQSTLSGLTGLGDLVLTATGDQSRNRRVGFELGRGEPLDTILHRMAAVAEGVPTCRAARQLGHRLHVNLPIIDAVYQVLYERKDPHAAIRDLMERPLTVE